MIPLPTTPDPDAFPGPGNRGGALDTWVPGCVQELLRLLWFTASFAGPGLVAGVAWPSEAPGLCVPACPAWGPPVEPTGRQLPTLLQTAFCCFPEGHSRQGPWGLASLPLSDCPLLPLPKCLPRKSTPKYRWKIRMLTATPSSTRTSHPHRSCHHLLLPNPTPSQSRGQPQGPAGHLSCFSWAFHSAVPPAHLAEEETEAKEGNSWPKVTRRVGFGTGAGPSLPGYPNSSVGLYNELSREALTHPPSTVCKKW